jgi:DNA-binding beta-propeller fold protein YncE
MTSACRTVGLVAVASSSVTGIFAPVSDRHHGARGTEKGNGKRMMRERALVAGSLAMLLLPALPAAGTDASGLPPLTCSLVRAPEARCAWRPGGSCTWEEGGTPTSCRPVAGAAVRLRPAGSYHGGAFNASASAGIAYDPPTHRLFVANAATQSIDVVDLGGHTLNPDRPPRLRKRFSIDVAALIPPRPDAAPSQAAPRGAAVPRNVVVRRDGVLAVVLQDGQENPIRRGKVALYRTNGGPNDPPLKVVNTGFMPARATFTPDGRYLLIANEGEPSQDYLTDPPGSVTLVDLTRGIPSAAAVDIAFWRFNRLKAELIAEGVRITGPNLRTPDPEDTASVARDLEPADIAVSPDSRTAWVTLAENNAVAVLDIRRARFTDIMPFGFKDHRRARNRLDPTDNDDARGVTNGIKGINIETWPLRGLYMPRQLTVKWHRGTLLLLYPNDGIRRNFEAFGDEIRLDDASLAIDPAAFAPAVLERLRRLRLKISRVDGDKDGDGDLDHLYALGGRSFAIRLPDNRLLFDSGDDFERITAQAMRDTFGRFVPDRPYFLFNTPDDENSFDETSDLRGPEPFSIATGTIGRRTLVFTGLERIGGIMTYDITDPARARFQHYINNRNFALDPKTVCDEERPEAGAECPNVGDLSAEDLLFVSRRESPLAAPLLVASNATSGTTTVFVVDGGGR